MKLGIVINSEILFNDGVSVPRKINDYLYLKAINPKVVSVLSYFGINISQDLNRKSKGDSKFYHTHITTNSVNILNALLVVSKENKPTILASDPSLLRLIEYICCEILFIKSNNNVNIMFEDDLDQLENIDKDFTKLYSKLKYKEQILESHIDSVCFYPKTKFDRNYFKETYPSVNKKMKPKDADISVVDEDLTARDLMKELNNIKAKVFSLSGVESFNFCKILANHLSNSLSKNKIPVSTNQFFNRLGGISNEIILQYKNYIDDLITGFINGEESEIELELFVKIGQLENGSIPNPFPQWGKLLCPLTKASDKTLSFKAANGQDVYLHDLFNFDCPIKDTREDFIHNKFVEILKHVTQAPSSNQRTTFGKRKAFQTKICPDSVERFLRPKQWAEKAQSETGESENYEEWHNGISLYINKNDRKTLDWILESNNLVLNTDIISSLVPEKAKDLRKENIKNIMSKILSSDIKAVLYGVDELLSFDTRKYWPVQMFILRINKFSIKDLTAKSKKLQAFWSTYSIPILRHNGGSCSILVGATHYFDSKKIENISAVMQILGKAASASFPSHQVHEKISTMLDIVCSAEILGDIVKDQVQARLNDMFNSKLKMTNGSFDLALFNDKENDFGMFFTFALGKTEIHQYSSSEEKDQVVKKYLSRSTSLAPKEEPAQKAETAKPSLVDLFAV